MSVILRRMEYKDLQQVYDLEKQIFADAWPPESFINEIENRHRSYPFLMTQENKIVGYGVVLHLPGELHINNIAVVPEYRRQGYGKKMMQHILNKFSDTSEMYLEVRRSNTAAIRLYEKFNFERVYLRKAYYGDGEDALVMRRVSALEKG